MNFDEILSAENQRIAILRASNIRKAKQLISQALEYVEINELINITNEIYAIEYEKGEILTHNSIRQYEGIL